MGVNTKSRILHVSEILFQQILAVFILLIFWEIFKSYNFSQKPAWHIILCVAGFALFLAEGVQVYRKESIVSFGETRKDKIKVHGIIMVTGFICMSIGIILKISQKEDSNLAHFTTVHGKLGLSAWILAFVASIGGAISAQFSFAGKTATIRLVHLLVGVIAYLLGIINIGYGLKYLDVGDNGKIFLIVLLSIYVCYSFMGPLLSVKNYFKK
nr:uncharacterized protein LOC111503566 [Leptinotarsa decemlineata]